MSEAIGYQTKKQRDYLYQAAMELEKTGLSKPESERTIAEIYAIAFCRESK